MSGIFAYIGSDPGRDILFKGISMLEKRGCDTCGITLKIEDGFTEIKVKGKSSDLLAKSGSIKSEAGIGIAQCGSSLRCKASSITAAPASNNLYAVACDGYIENFDALKHWTKEPFPIATDEDLLLASLCIIDNQNKIEAIKKLSNMLVGVLSFAFISSAENAVYCKSGGAPLLIGSGENGFYLSSELNALIPFCEKYTVLSGGESARITFDRVTIYDSKYKRTKAVLHSIPEQSYFENDYKLTDEIYYCPLAARETYNHLVKGGALNFDSLKLSKRSLERLRRIIITGSGTSYNTAVIGKHLFEMLGDIPTYAVSSGEFRYSSSVIDKNTLLIAISHRGENSDTLGCIRRAKSAGAQVIALTSNVTSAVARECQSVINPGCDFDSADISLRSYISNYMAIAFLALYCGNKCSVVTELYLSVAIKMAEMISGKISSAIKNTVLNQYAADRLVDSGCVFVSGIGINSALALEAAQKINQIAGVNAAAFQLSELLYMGEEVLSSSLVLAIITNKELLQKSLFRLRQLQSLGAEIIIYTTENLEEEISGFPNIIASDDTLPVFNALPCIAGIYKMSITAGELRERSGQSEAS